MSIESLKNNINHLKKIIQEIYIFQKHLDTIEKLEFNRISVDTKEKRLLEETIFSLKNQLRILNNSIPDLLNNISFYKGLNHEKKESKELVNVNYKDKEEDINLTISKKDREKFLENLSRSSLSINKLNKKFALEKPKYPEFGKPNSYAKISNRFFRNISSNLIEKGYFQRLNKDLRKISSPFVLSTYLSMIFMTISITFVVSLFILFFLLFYNISFVYPFLSSTEQSIIFRFVKFFWIIFALPLVMSLLMYLYPKSEGKNIGSKIKQELPFAVIHMSAISAAGIEPQNIFKIILKNKDYKYLNREFRKIMNLINFRGYDLVSALKQSAKTSPSSKLKELLNGFSTSITSGGDLHSFLEKHGEGLLFDYKLEREKYTKVSEIFMDIYISVVIAAPMILLILFVIMGSTGMNWLGLDPKIMGYLIILIVALLNTFFLIFLRLKQPTI